MESWWDRAWCSRWKVERSDAVLPPVACLLRPFCGVDAEAAEVAATRAPLAVVEGGCGGAGLAARFWKASEAPLRAALWGPPADADETWAGREAWEIIWAGGPG